MNKQESFVTPNVAPTPSNVVQFAPRSTRNVWNYASGIGAIAASIIAVFLGISLYNQSQNNRVKSDQLAELNQKLSASEQKLIDAQMQLERERQEREFLGSPSTIVASLAGTETSPTAKARLVFDKTTGKALLFVENLPDAPQGKAYQIWFISDPTKPTPGHTFETRANGKAELRDQIPANSLNSTIFAVTLEPVGGSAAPTGEKYLLSRPL